MPLSRKDIADMSKEDRSTFMKKNWGLIKEACDKIGGETVEALKNMKPSLYGIGGTSVGGTSASKYKVLLDKFTKVNDKVNEFDLFKELKLGEKEAHALIKQGLKAVEPKDRKHVAFVDGNYILKAIGEVGPVGCISVKIPVKKNPEVITAKPNIPAEGVKKGL